MRRSAALWVLVATLSIARTGAPQDLNVSKRDIISASDFRVRTSAALALGRSGDASAVPLLEQALGDPNAAVRTAAAAALGALGDVSCIPALDSARQRETEGSARAQMSATLAALTRAATLQGVQLVVAIGSMRNSTATRGADVADVLRSATTSRARTMRNFAVAMPSDAAMLARAASRHVPVVMLDGTVTRLTQVTSGTDVTCQAEVEFLVRKVPDQSLRSTLAGRAAAVGTGTTSARGVATLQDQAIGGAVESALQNADQGLLLAAR